MAANSTVRFKQEVKHFNMSSTQSGAGVLKKGGRPPPVSTNLCTSSCLMSAISSNDNETVSELLEKLDINAVNTALHVACNKKNNEALDILLSKTGIDINIKGSSGWTPLHEACNSNNRYAVVKLLNRPEIDVNAKSSISKWTPLHEACRSSLHSIVRKLLVSPGIDVNARNIKGDTPIMDCAGCCNEDALDAMLGDPRVNLNIKDKKGRGLEEMVGTSGYCSREEKDACLEMIKNEKIRRENGKVGEEGISPAGIIEGHIVKIEKINKEIGVEEEKFKNNVDMRKQKILDLAKKHKEASFLLEKNQSNEITVLQETLAREDNYEQRYIASLKNHRDELTQELEKLTNDASSDERCKLEPFKKLLECPICFDLMRPPTKIWMCRNTHVICDVCKDNPKAEGGNCHICSVEPIIGRNYMAENFARIVFND